MPALHTMPSVIALEGRHGEHYHPKKTSMKRRKRDCACAPRVMSDRWRKRHARCFAGRLAVAETVAGGNLADAIRARFRRWGGSSFGCPPGSRCVSLRSSADDHTRHQRPVGAHEAGAGREGRRLDGRPAGHQSLHDQHHPSGDPPWHDASSRADVEARSKPRPRPCSPRISAAASSASAQTRLRPMRRSLPKGAAPAVPFRISTPRSRP